MQDIDVQALRARLVKHRKSTIDKRRKSLASQLAAEGTNLSFADRKIVKSMDTRAKVIRANAASESSSHSGAGGEEPQTHSDSSTTKGEGLFSYANMPQSIEASGLALENITLDDSQEQAIDKLIHGKHVCLIGAAGTGKTTMIKIALGKMIYGDEESGIDPIGLRHLKGEQGPSVALCAFTGIASQVIRKTMPDWLAPACKTIHSLLEFKPASASDDPNMNTFFPSRDENNPIDHDIVIIDEASMMGLDLWHKVIDACRPHTRVILIGDLNQLKPVADATMFAYALAAGLDERNRDWDISELTTIHRQKEEAANRIVDAAHAILNGKAPTFDKLEKGKDWRVVGMELSISTQKAQAQIMTVVNQLRLHEFEFEPGRKIFEPYDDLLLTAGNGYNHDDSSSFVQQSPLNEVLSRLIQPPDESHPIYIIDAGIERRRFAVGHKVMCLKNEAPSRKDRVTNGMTGRIIKISKNGAYQNRSNDFFGPEEEVKALMKEQQLLALNGRSQDQMLDDSLAVLSSMDPSALLPKESEALERQASHIVDVEYVNGAIRSYASAAGVAGIQLAYAVTVHKAQGSQADTVLIVVHQAAKRALNREWFYTGVTRAARRVVVLYTPLGLAKAVSHQQIYGKNLAEKVARYANVIDAGNQVVRLTKTKVME